MNSRTTHVRPPHAYSERKVSGRTGVDRIDASDDREVSARCIMRILTERAVQFESKVPACNETIDGKSSLRACEIESPVIIEKQRRIQTQGAHTCGHRVQPVCELENKRDVNRRCSSASIFNCSASSLRKI